MYFTALSIVFLIYSSYSLIFCSLACLFIISIKKNLLKCRSHGFIFLMFLGEVICCLGNMITSIYYIANEESLGNKTAIDIIGCITTIGYNYKNIMMFSLCFFSYLHICWKMRPLNKKLLAMYLILMLMIAIMLACLPFFFSGFHMIFMIESWIQSESAAFYLYFLPFIISFFVSMFMLYKCWKTYMINYNNGQKKLIQLFLFPISLMISYFLRIIRMIISLSGVPMEHSDAYIFIEFMFLPMHGIVNSIYYFYLKRRYSLKFQLFVFPESINRHSSLEQYLIDSSLEDLPPQFNQYIEEPESFGE